MAYNSTNTQESTDILSRLKKEPVKTKKSVVPFRTEKKRVFLVDDHPLYRQGLAEFINRESDLTVCGEAENGTEALRVISETKPDLVILDISLKDSDGIDLIKSLKALDPAMSMLTLSMHDESFYAERALRAGAKGYIMKQEPTEKIMSAIRRVLTGKIFMSEAMADRMLEKQISGIEENRSSISGLSDRELEVFRSIGEGLTTAKIASNLHLSVKTVETYRANIKNKLNLKNNTELICYAVQWIQSGKEI